MGMDIYNNAQLRAAMQEILKDVFREVTDKVLVDLRIYIQSEVYDSHGENSVYYMLNGAEPTGQFKDAWIWDKANTTTRSIVQEMIYDWSSMAFHEKTWLHASDPKYVKKQAGDSREFLDRILNQEGKLSSLWMTVERPKGYWDEFIKEMFDNGKLEKYFDEAFAEYGIVRE